MLREPLETYVEKCYVLLFSFKISSSTVTNSICVSHVLEARRVEPMDLLHTMVFPVPCMGPRDEQLWSSDRQGLGPPWPCLPSALKPSPRAITEAAATLPTTGVDPLDQNPNSISCPQSLGLNSAHLGFCLESSLCNPKLL